MEDRIAITVCDFLQEWAAHMERNGVIALKADARGVLADMYIWLSIMIEGVYVCIRLDTVDFTTRQIKGRAFTSAPGHVSLDIEMLDKEKTSAPKE